MGIRVFAITFLLVTTLAVSIASCSSALVTPAAPQPTGTPIIESPDIATPTLSQTPSPKPTSIISPNVQPKAGEVPEKILEEIFADLMERTGAESEEIQIVKAEAVTWQDGSLGCPKPGELYIQILIKGFWVVLRVGSVEYDYRASESGDWKLCQ